jgi:hypothetical protein
MKAPKRFSVIRFVTHYYILIGATGIFGLATSYNDALTFCRHVSGNLEISSLPFASFLRCWVCRHKEGDNVASQKPRPQQVTSIHSDTMCCRISVTLRLERIQKLVGRIELDFSISV